MCVGQHLIGLLSPGFRVLETTPRMCADGVDVLLIFVALNELSVSEQSLVAFTGTSHRVRLLRTNAIRWILSRSVSGSWSCFKGENSRYRFAYVS